MLCMGSQERIRYEKVCDGRKNCPEGEDEEDCQERECPAGRPHRCSDASCVAATAPCDGTEDCPDGSDEYDCPPEEYDEYSDYEEYYYEADTERPPSTTTTTTTTTTESKPKQSIDVDMKKEEETQVEPEPNSEEEIFIEGLPRDTETVVEEPNDAVQEAEDMEAVETMLEPVEEPAASSEQGAGGGACVSPTCLLTLVPLFVFTCRNVWMR
ncbi:Transmembrane protease serine 7 [Chionoecetes opilio]|uniref:Transmembrane protease serine 7 n=1 Tax=Chionoecetes opilio TaxID=41210 RepID=A0A8J5CN62_CHIOP|nr:Transmembrane protease serine 7 [Chionoecetes opilio]